MEPWDGEYIWKEGPQDALSDSVGQAELRHGAAQEEMAFFLICITEDYRGPAYGSIS